MTSYRDGSVVMGRDRDVLTMLLRRVQSPYVVLDATANTRKMWKGVAVTGNKGRCEPRRQGAP